MLKITKNLLPVSKYSLKSPHTMTPTGICVHNTYNDASAVNEIAYMVRNDLQISFHYAVDDIQAVQGLLENRNGWHSGDGGSGAGNRKHIAIEICYSKSGGDRFIKAEQNAVLLIVDILKRYGWGIDRVKKHQDFSGKYCPHRTLDMGWDRFLNMVKLELEGGDWKSEAVVLPVDKRKYIANKDTALYSMANGKVVKEFSKGQEIGADYKVGNWYMTNYSFDRNIRNGFKVEDFDLWIVPEIVPESPVIDLEVPDSPTDITPNPEENDSLENTLEAWKTEVAELLSQIENLKIERDRFRKDYMSTVEELNRLKEGRDDWINKLADVLHKLFSKE
jgi:N-acetylmuramoyl-L-alanine amidase CwlA